MNATEIVELIARMTDPSELETDDSAETLSRLIAESRAALEKSRIYEHAEPHIFEHETPAYHAFLCNIDGADVAQLRRCVKYIIDDLYGAGEGEADSPRYLDPDKEWSGDTANEVRESLGAFIDTPDRDPDGEGEHWECPECGPMCTCEKAPHACPARVLTLAFPPAWCAVCGKQLTETGACPDDHLDDIAEDEPSYCGACGERIVL